MLKTPESDENPSNTIMTAEDVAELLGMGVDWVYAETRAGRIPHLKLGRYRRYRRTAIEKWLAELEEAA